MFAVLRRTILIVDDFAAFRRFFSSVLGQRADLEVIGQASDGLEAVQLADQLAPDLVLLDVGLPRLHGIEAGRRIRQVAPNSKILFVSLDASPEVVQEALELGAHGYLLKTDAHSELLSAVDEVLGGQRFLSRGLRLPKTRKTSDSRRERRHDLQLYSEEGVFLGAFATFVAAALGNGDAAVVLATKPHREDLVQRLKAEGIDAVEAARRGTYLALDAAELLSTIMVNGVVDRRKFFEGLSGLVVQAKKATQKTDARVAVCGECVALLCAEGNPDAAIQLEKVCNQLVDSLGVDILCAYPMSVFNSGGDVLDRICREHTAVSSL